MFKLILLVMLVSGESHEFDMGTYNTKAACEARGEKLIAMNPELDQANVMDMRFLCI